MVIFGSWRSICHRCYRCESRASFARDSFGYVNGAIGQLVIQALSGGFQALRPPAACSCLPCSSARSIRITVVLSCSSSRFTVGTVPRKRPMAVPSRALPMVTPPTRRRRSSSSAIRCGVSASRCAPRWPAPDGSAVVTELQDYRLLEGGVDLQTANENTIDVLARGAAGGCDGLPNAVVLYPTPRMKGAVDRRVSRFPVAAGEVVSLRSGGGGGVGRRSSAPPTSSRPRWPTNFSMPPRRPPSTGLRVRGVGGRTAVDQDADQRLRSSQEETVS